MTETRSIHDELSADRVMAEYPSSRRRFSSCLSRRRSP